MGQPFFSSPIFGWFFFSTLIVLLAAAAVIDIRTTRIPKKLTLGIASAGLVFNVCRGVLLGDHDLETWELGKGPAWLGALDGLLFSLTGLLFAFIVFFGIWMLGSCGGGDVKLCAAIGAWIGAVYTIFLLFATVATLMIWFVAKLLIVGLPKKKVVRPAKGTRNSKTGALPRFRMTFSLPVAVATALVMLWCFRRDLQLVNPQPADQEAQHVMLVNIKG